MSAHKIGFQYFIYKPYVWMTGLALLSTGSYFNLQWQTNQQGKAFQDARPSVETLAFESKFSFRPGDQKDALTQIDFSPISHSNWVKKE